MSDELQHFFVTSLVSNKTLLPRVQIELDTVKTQVSAEKAREIALMILEASESASSDAFLVKFLCDKTGAPPDNATGIILQEFREFRDTEREREQKDTGGKP